jgi:serine/threonine protein kinase
MSIAMNKANTTVHTRRAPYLPDTLGERERHTNALPNGTQLGEFEIIELIGEGGFGIVYLAYDHSLQRRVALKEYMPSGLAMRSDGMSVTVRSEQQRETFTIGLKSFINEARMLAQFDSPALVKVYLFWEGNGTAYMVMPYYQGVTLKQALAQHRIKPTEAWLRLLLSDLFDAIDIIHRANCLHRDIAPDNILLLDDGRPLLLDFGAARRVIGDLTQCLTAILKPGFAPIEQYADIPGLRQGPWTDIYALAAVVYYLIAGKGPPPAVARMVHDQPYLAQLVGKGKYSEPFLAALDRAMAVKPEQRFQSIADLRRALNIMEPVPRTLPLEPDVTMPATQTAPRSEEKTKPASEPAAAAAGAAGAEAAHEDGMPPSMAAFAGGKSRFSKLQWVLPGLLLGGLIATGTYLMSDRPANTITPHWIGGGSSEGGTGSGTQASSDASEQIAPAAPAAPAPAPAQSTVPPVASIPPELEKWRQASAADSEAAYQDYLKQFPTGRFAPIAKLRIERMQLEKAEAQAEAASPQTAQAAPAPKEKAAESKVSAAERKKAKAGKKETHVASVEPPPETSPEEDTWNRATVIDTPAAYRSYLSAYPDGRFAGLAKDKLGLYRQDDVAVPALPAASAPSAANGPPKDEDKPAATKPAQPDKPPPAQSAPSVPSPSSTAPAPKSMEESKVSLPPDPPPVSGNQSIGLDGQVISGDFSIDPKSGKVSGNVKINWANGDRYEGTLVRGVKEGRGKFVWTNGQRYSGEWAHDTPNGKGRFIFPDGSRYEGEVKDGLRNGRGITHFKNGDVYSGEWVNGKSNGHGRYTWADGSYWDGEFANGQRTEDGKMVFSESALHAAGSKRSSNVD